MTERASHTTLARRVIAEHRRAVLTLTIVLVVNVLVFAFYVYPLAQRVANVEERTRVAEQALAAARQEHAGVSGALTGKGRAAAELDAFYGSVLPQDFTDARRRTYLRLNQLAEQSGLELGRMAFEPAPMRDSTLTRVRIEMALVGSYPDVRSFIHQLESAPEFVVIDNVRLAGGTDEGGWLQLRLDLSTYYQDGAS